MGNLAKIQMSQKLLSAPQGCVGDIPVSILLACVTLNSCTPLGDIAIRLLQLKFIHPCGNHHIAFHFV